MTADTCIRDTACLSNTDARALRCADDVNVGRVIADRSYRLAS